MAQQINLYDPALLRKRDWFALANVVLLAGLLAILVTLAGFLVRAGLPELHAQVATSETQLKAMREQVLVLGKRVAERKADPRIEQELNAARQMAGAHDVLLDTLRVQLAVDRPFFADYLRGLARQAINGLWITGFTWEAGGEGLEIRGRTLDPALLPEYIRRLNNEPAFRGQAFSALKLAEGKPDGGGDKSVAPADVSQKAPFHEFVLVPVKSVERSRKMSGKGQR